MAIDFRYVPVSGDLPGASFEKQTERAFNELGANIDGAIDSANEAKEIAQNAQDTANNALQTAQSAVTTAQEANETADNALAAATAAQTAADNAQDTANQARQAAAIAQTTADTAQTTANAAQTTANTAQSAANDAQQSADSAMTTAQTALSTANSAASIHDEQEEAVDLDDYFTEPRKLFLTNADSLHMPTGVALPLYVAVSITDTLKGATQFAWQEAAPELLYIRTAIVTYPDDPEEPYSAAWSEWTAIGGGTGGIPSGGIIMWSGAIANIPEGWALCDGQNSTPDLRDRFIIGAGDAYAVGATGGAASVTPSGAISNTTATGTVAAAYAGVSTQNTALDWNQLTWHQHPSIRVSGTQASDGHPIANQSNPQNMGWWSTGAAGGSAGHLHAVTDPTHVHNFIGTAHGHEFAGIEEENIPPYYALAFIMKL